VPNALSKWQELLDEFRTVVWEGGGVADAVLPPLLFALLNAWLGLLWAVLGGLALALGFLVLRLIQGQSVWRALYGVAGIALAAGLAWALARAEAYFLPGILTGGLTVLAALVSVLVKRPLVAWTSHIARRWPLDWYWHPQIRPAYTEVTWIWIAVYSLRLGLQWALYQREQPDLLAVFNVLSGWPATILLLVISYLYGLWRLGTLGGPSVEEFRQDEPPPWEGQQRGF
jgi:hypothetical protein